MPETSEAAPPSTFNGAGESGLPALFDRIAAAQPGSDMPRASEPTPLAAPEQPPQAPASPSTAPEPTVQPEVATPTAEEAFVPPDALLDKADAADVEPTIDWPEEPPVALRTEKSKADYKKWRGEYAATVKENALLRQQVESSRNGATDQAAFARIQELEGRLQELSTVTERVDIELHPAFQNQFIKPRAQMLDQARKTIANAGGDPALIDRAMRAEGDERGLLLDEAGQAMSSEYSRKKLTDIVFDIEKLDDQKAQVLQDVKGTHARMEVEAKMRAHQEMQQQEQQCIATIDAVTAHLRDRAGFEFLKEVPGNEQWNQGVRASIEEARYLLTKSTNPAEVAAAAVLASQAPRYQKAYHAERQQRMALQAELAELKGAEPGLGNGAGGGEESGEELTGMQNIFNRAKQTTTLS